MWWPALAAIGLAGIVGALVAILPIAAFGLVAIVCLAALVAIPGGPRRAFYWTLAVVLVGYAVAGRGFAYVGVSPVFIGEICLALAILAVLLTRPLRRPGYVHLFLGAFVLWGALRTIPYVSAYGIDAARDAVVWIYGLFAVTISLIVRPEDVKRLLAVYGRVLPYFLLWVPVFAITWFAARSAFPVVPGTDVEFPFFKAGDMGVHLAGAGAFLLLGMNVGNAFQSVRGALWLPWLLGVGIVISYSRSAMLAIAMAATTLVFRRSLASWAVPGVLSLMLLGAVGVAGLEVDVGRRTVSVEQVISNVESVLGSGENDELSGTREWREAWWAKIADYTLNGPYFWTGKGYGVSLAEDDGFLGDDPNLRAPHSAHFNILARAGVPGLMLWLGLLGAVIVVLARAAVAAHRAGLRQWVLGLGWITAYWLASVVNMSFDVYIEGPPGGILFWALTGLGVAMASCVHEVVGNADKRPWPQVAAPIVGEALRGASKSVPRGATKIRWNPSSSDDVE
jgi:hypothetical protein